MFVGFNLELDEFDSSDVSAYYQIGQNVLAPYKARVSTQLEKFVDSDGILDGSMIRENWFPQINADVFLSHSHANEKEAIVFAGILKKELGINTFIDSCVWGYSDRLLKIIDDAFAKQDDGYYNYQIRNKSTSHVHMLLSSALSMMIDKTECLFFLNTPASIISSDVEDKTFSPWIYSEIITAQIIRKRLPEEHRGRIQKSFSVRKALTNESAQIMKHKVTLEDFSLVDFDLLYLWIQSKGSEHPLDTLYHLLDNSSRAQIIN